MSKLDNRKTEYISKIEKIKNPLDLDNIKTEIFGKNGFLTLEFKKLGNLPAEEKKIIALQLNKAKEDLLLLTHFRNCVYQETPTTEYAFQEATQALPRRLPADNQSGSAPSGISDP